MRSRIGFVCTFVLIATVAVANEDDAARAKTLLDKTRVTSLLSTDLQPYELKASFKLHGKDHKDQSGTLVRDWVSPSQWREDVTLGPYHFTIARDGDKWWTAPQAFEPLQISQVRLAVGEIEAMARPSHHEPSKFEGIKDTKIDGVLVTCVKEKRLGKKVNTCVEPSSGKVLRLEINDDYQVQYSDFRPFRDRTIPHLSTVQYEGKNALDVTVADIEDLNPIDVGEFVAPRNAFEDPTCEGDFENPKPIKTDNPVFPPGTEHINDAHLIVGAMVLSDGTVTNVYPIRSAGIFDKQAANAILGWTFHPATCNGTPVRSRINVEVDFRRY